MKKAIVTGATGFIGKFLVRELVKQNVEVIAVVRRGTKNLNTINALPVKIVECNIADYHMLPDMIADRDIDVVFHIAWQGVSDLDARNEAIQMQNLQSTLDLIDAMETVSNLFVSICVGIIAIMPFVFPVMVNQQYGNAYYQIPILLIAVIFQILVGLYSAIYIALKKSSTIARTTIAGAIINVLVNLALIRFIGLYAASISTLVSYASTALYRRIDIRKYIKIKVNVKNILLNSVAVVFVTLSYYFNITILNVAALVIACIYAVGINWKLIKMFFAEIRKYKKEGN